MDSSVWDVRLSEIPGSLGKLRVFVRLTEITFDELVRLTEILERNR